MHYFIYYGTFGPSPPGQPLVAGCIYADAMPGQLPTLSALLQAFDLNRYGVATFAT